MPHQCIDALSLGARYVTEMESFMARRIDPFEPAVFSIGTFHAGTVRNVVPERAELTVTLRCQSEATRAFILDGAQKVLHGLCSAAGARGEAVIRHGLPVLVTDEQQELYAEALAEELGLAPVRPKHGQMGAEDFAYFAQKVPSAFVWLGARNEEKGFTHLLHDPRFDFDEAALPLGLRACTAPCAGQISSFIGIRRSALSASGTGRGRCAFRAVRVDTVLQSGYTEQVPGVQGKYRRPCTRLPSMREGGLQAVKASVIIPNLNGAGWLKDSIESIRAQTFRDFELIVVDNGSADESLAIARSYVGQKGYTLIENGATRAFRMR